jgi:ankyrin repeat protein
VQGLPLLEVAKTGKLTQDTRALLPIWAPVPQLVDKNGVTPLALAARHGHTHIAVFLLVNGANVNITVREFVLGFRYIVFYIWFFSR